ncbi:S8 family serine peptidase [Paenibacillus aquistagni]|uniref:Subtilase family protein n=1 Tax=Paenibacillus aquistagni TaxID=1852522 RepID=A0A1X7J789_9BACL|nr:S8 family serine peptidase [Paenibacillus aquistagni]SMG23370.1 Subtilase family protein [Paenibacillus aquistagni]
MASEPRIIVKFRPDVTIPYEDAAERFLPVPISLLWQQLQSQFPGAALSLNRLIRVQTGEQLADLLNTARARSGQEPPNLLSVMAIDVAGFVDRQSLVTALRALPFVEFAYQETPLVQASVDPSNDPLAPTQGYLLPAPFGIDAFFAWSLPGADGEGVKFLDIERGWNLTHEDLAGVGITELNQSVPGNEFHSTACLGIVLAQDNDKGVIGIAPKVKGAIASSLRNTLPDAFVLAAGFLGAGDVLLIEDQSTDLKPVEMDAHIAMLIHALTLLGIVVIEPAGNGGHDLDALLRNDGTSLDRNTFNFFDTGAIMVGARHAALRARIAFSCHGNRVDCHAWGENIVTTSSVNGPFGPYMGLNPLAGDTGFGGTSGASAIVAGAAVSLQGIARSRGITLTPARVREILSGPFNTATDNPDGIGVMPDLREAVNHI